MSRNWTRSHSQTLIVLACLLAFAGCGSEVEEPEEPPAPMEEAEAEAVFPVILHNQTIRNKGYAWRVQSSDITDVELLERTEEPRTGSQTAVLWFKTVSRGQPLKVKVRVIYRRVTSQSKDGLEVFSYPVSKVTTLEVE